MSFLDFFGLFITLAGFILGLGAVTVIDLHGFLARQSSYWTEATIRTHKITKPLIWIGILFVSLGLMVLYRDQGLSGTPTIHALLVCALIINGLFLSFKVSPYLLRQEAEGKAKELLPKKLQKQITLSFLISFFGWWGALVLLVKFLLTF